MKYLICNLKAYKTYPEIISYKNSLASLINPNINLILAPNNLYLSLFQDINLNLASQDLPLYAHEHLTGDNSLNQLLSLNVKYVILGHYERRLYYHETEANLITKIKNALNSNLNVIYCIGETKEELDRKIEYQVLERSIARILNNVAINQFHHLIIAYEPTYMIGSNTPLDINKIASMISFIKNLIYEYYQVSIPVIYGGNITLDNIKSLNKLSNLDGFIISSSILEATNLALIIENISKN